MAEIITMNIVRAFHPLFLSENKIKTAPTTMNDSSQNIVSMDRHWVNLFYSDCLYAFHLLNSPSLYMSLLKVI